MGASSGVDGWLALTMDCSVSPQVVLENPINKCGIIKQLSNESAAKVAWMMINMFCICVWLALVLERGTPSK